MRELSALQVVETLRARGAHIRAHDPVVTAGGFDHGSTFAEGCVEETAALVVLTEWPQYRAIDWEDVAGRAPHLIVVDNRDVVDSGAVVRSGLDFVGNGYCPAGERDRVTLSPSHPDRRRHTPHE